MAILGIRDHDIGNYREAPVQPALLQAVSALSGMRLMVHVEEYTLLVDLKTLNARLEHVEHRTPCVQAAETTQRGANSPGVSHPCVSGLGLP